MHTFNMNNKKVFDIFSDYIFELLNEYGWKQTRSLLQKTQVQGFKLIRSSNTSIMFERSNRPGETLKIETSHIKEFA